MKQSYKTVKIGKRLVGEGEPCYIVFECGATHDGLESAKKLARAVADSGADAIKFQMVDPNRIMSNKDAEITFMTPSGEKTELVYDALKRRSLSPDEWRELKEYCDGLGLDFFSTAAFKDEIDLLVEIGSAAIKINAGDVNHYSLIEYAAKTGLPIFLDGRAKYDELERGVRICEAAGNENIVIMHCPSGYPSRNDGVNLNTLSALKDIYRYPIGFSDHSPEKIMNFAAMVKGADIVEKTLTLDKSAPHVEHFMSLEPAHAKEFVKEMRAIEEAYGSPRIMFDTTLKQRSRRSIIARQAVRKGENITRDHISFQRPGGRGFDADQYSDVVGKKAASDIPAGDPITPDMLE